MHFLTIAGKKKSNKPAKLITSNSIEPQITKTLQHFPKLYSKLCQTPKVKL